ncbi:MAG TPA: hypothetical protein VHY84_17000 [Bryobacteraceae bacterium]|jgi:hypothetical protein|nr:hypothetical protein [Bryobacteraceae bacterium]
MADAAGIEFAGASDSRLIFSGPPGRLQGVIRLTNPTASKQTLRSLTVNADQLTGAAGLPLAEIPMLARLNAGQQAAIRSTIALDAHTPPGSYPLTITVGSRAIPASAFVTEVVDFRIQPDEVTILAGADSTYEREFVIENAGNVPLPLGERCEAPLVDSIDLPTAMLVGLHKAAKLDAKGQVESWLREWGEREGGMLVVLRDPIILGPGQKMTAKARFQLPELRPFRNYQATLQLYNGSLSVSIYTTKKSGSQKPTAALKAS